MTREPLLIPSTEGTTAFEHRFSSLHRSNPKGGLRATPTHTWLSVRYYLGMYSCSSVLLNCHLSWSSPLGLRDGQTQNMYSVILGGCILLPRWLRYSALELWPVAQHSYNSHNQSQGYRNSCETLSGIRQHLLSRTTHTTSTPGG